MTQSKWFRLYITAQFLSITIGICVLLYVLFAGIHDAIRNNNALTCISSISGASLDGRLWKYDLEKFLEREYQPSRNILVDALRKKCGDYLDISIYGYSDIAVRQEGYFIDAGIEFSYVWERIAITILFICSTVIILLWLRWLCIGNAAITEARELITKARKFKIQSASSPPSDESPHIT